MTVVDNAAALDPAALDRLVRIGGQEFLIEMIDLFLENAPPRVEAARAALESADFRTLYRAAHSLKSTAANLGANALRVVSERVEKSAVEEDLQALPALVEEMAGRYAETHAELLAERRRRTGA